MVDWEKTKDEEEEAHRGVLVDDSRVRVPVEHGNVVVEICEKQSTLTIYFTQEGHRGPVDPPAPLFLPQGILSFTSLDSTVSL